MYGIYKTIFHFLYEWNSIFGILKKSFPVRPIWSNQQQIIDTKSSTWTGTIAIWALLKLRQK